MVGEKSIKIDCHSTFHWERADDGKNVGVKINKGHGEGHVSSSSDCILCNAAACFKYAEVYRERYL